jgi:hypothetical protein
MQQVHQRANAFRQNDGDEEEDEDVDALDQQEAERDGQQGNADRQPDCARVIVTDQPALCAWGRSSPPDSSPRRTFSSFSSISFWRGTEMGIVPSLSILPTHCAGTARTPVLQCICHPQHPKHMPYKEESQSSYPKPDERAISPSAVSGPVCLLCTG